MVKFIGLALILAAGTGAGFYASHRLLQRVRMLEQLERVFGTLLRLLTYSAAPMGQLWRQLATMDGVGDCPLVADTVNGLEEMPFSAAFGAAVERLSATGQLHPSERQLLLSFGMECGRYDLPRQTAQMRGCIQGLEELRDGAREQLKSRGQVYRMMGVSGGAALALLLM